MFEKYQDTDDTFIKDISHNHSITTLGSIMKEGIKTSKRDYNVYTVLTHNENIHKLIRCIAAGIWVLASKKNDVFDLDDLFTALNSLNIIVSNNEELHRRIIGCLDTSFVNYRLVSKINDGEWRIEVKITSGKSRVEFIKRLDNLTGHYGDQDDLTGLLT